MKRRLRRILGGLCLLALGGLLAVIAARWLLRPPPMAKTEIFRGVHYLSSTVESRGGVRGRMMVFEVELDAPGLEFFIRPPDPEAVGEGADYVLRWADLEVLRHDLSLLVNGSTYAPGEWWRSYPGARVRSGESLVIDGRETRQHEHSYLIWFDQTMSPHVETRKPPPAAAIRRARWAIGVQGLQVLNGKSNYGAYGDCATVMMRTFIGVDPDRKKMWFLIFEKTDAYTMIDTARDMGVVFGGQVDSDDGTWAIVGRGAKGVRPLTGIRGRRPIACYFGIRAAPVGD